MTKAQLRKKTNMLIKDAVKGMRKNIEKAIESGSMDVKNADDNFILPRSLLIALLKEEINQFDCKGTSFAQKIKKDSSNIYRCL